MSGCVQRPGLIAWVGAPRGGAATHGTGWGSSSGGRLGQGPTRSAVLDTAALICLLDAEGGCHGARWWMAWTSGTVGDAEVITSERRG